MDKIRYWYFHDIFIYAFLNYWLSFWIIDSSFFVLSDVCTCFPPCATSCLILELNPCSPVPVPMLAFTLCTSLYQDLPIITLMLQRKPSAKPQPHLRQTPARSVYINSSLMLHSSTKKAMLTFANIA